MVDLKRVKDSKDLVLLDSNSVFGPIRTVPVGNNEFLFNAKDCALLLEYKNTAKTIKKFVPDEHKIKLKNGNFKKSKHTESVCFESTSLSRPGDYFITEEGLYRLISSSKMEKAEEFKSWVFGELLPTFRKTGKYDMDDFVQSKYYSTIRQLPGWVEDERFKEDIKRVTSEVSQKNHTLKSHVWRDFIATFNDVYHVNLNLKITNLMKKYGIKQRPTTREYLDYAKLHKKAYIVFEMLRHDKNLKTNPEKLALTKAMCQVYYEHLTEEEQSEVDKLVEMLYRTGCIKALPDDHFVTQMISKDGKVTYVKFGQ